MAFTKKTRIAAIFLFVLFASVRGKERSEENSSFEKDAEYRSTKKHYQPLHDGAAFLFVDELKATLEKYLFGVCPPTFKSRWTQMQRNKNVTAPACDLDTEQQELAGRFATLAIRAHSAARADCARLGAALTNTLGELARTAANRRADSNAAANEANKKRKLSKSQKAKIQAKQRTALAVKKKAAALAAAAAAKISAS